ncbi:MAG: NAD+ synthase [Alphaproteobacteria bacterium]|nr:NAD+ synthase [Alphaproteobacteria bacterium]
MATDRLTIALAQINLSVGDIEGNRETIRAFRRKAAEAGADLVLFPELAISGYPPEDLVLRRGYQKGCRIAIEELAADTKEGPAMVVGMPWVMTGQLYNAVALLDEGEIKAVVTKRDLPNYGPFDEKRVFASGMMPEPVMFRGIKLGIVICEDMWKPYACGHTAKMGAEMLLAINGSPYEMNKFAVRHKLARARVFETGLPLAYINQICGQDELVFDGGSFIYDTEGVCKAQGPLWREHLMITKWERTKAGWQPQEGEKLADTDFSNSFQGPEAVYQAMILGLRDYVEKNGFPGVLLGLSGGIDSALAAAVAVDALGPDKVWTVMLPSPFTSEDSLEDAQATANCLGCRYDVLPISNVMQVLEQSLAETFTGKQRDTTEENLQSRIRGLALMALSNKFGWMLLATGNKSELSTGYATLYGDMCGGYAVLKDVYKATVTAVAKWRNENRPEGARGPAGAVMPARVISKPPTAELKPNQTDQDTLPPYDVLDDILKGLVELDQSVDDIVARGHQREIVVKVWHMLDKAEYKRRQAPPGVKLSTRAFGKDRRYPITNKYRGR